MGSHGDRTSPSCSREDRTLGRIEWGWYVPVEGDGPHLATYMPEQFPDLRLLSAVTTAAEESGFDTILVPTSLTNSAYISEAPYMDTWTVASALAPLTQRIRLLVATKIGETAPARLAKMGATLDHISGGRFAFNITTGGRTTAAFGDPLDHDSRYERTREAVKILKLLWREGRATFHGEHYGIADAISEPKPVQKPHPPIYFAGSSEMARAISAAEADVHLIHGERPDQLREIITDISKRAASLGRTVRFGVRLQVIMRETEEAAWRAARELMSEVDERVASEKSQIFRDMDAVGRQRLHAESWDTHLLAPNLWGGIRTIRSGAGTALLGAPEQLAERCLEYIGVGVSTFILSGFPHAEEAHRVGKDLIPLVEDRIAASG